MWVCTDTVLLSNQHSAPTIKNNSAWTPELLHDPAGFSIRSCFFSPPHKQAAAYCVSYHLCLSSLITRRYQCTLWSTSLEQEQLPPRLQPPNSLFGCGSWWNRDSPVTLCPDFCARSPPMTFVHFQPACFLSFVITSCKRFLLFSLYASKTFCKLNENSMSRAVMCTYKSPGAAMLPKMSRHSISKDFFFYLRDCFYFCFYFSFSSHSVKPPNANRSLFLAVITMKLWFV